MSLSKKPKKRIFRFRTNEQQQIGLVLDFKVCARCGRETCLERSGFEALERRRRWHLRPRLLLTIFFIIRRRIIHRR